MRPTFDRRLWILLFFISLQCISSTNQLNIYTGLQQVLIQSLNVSVEQNGKEYYMSSNILGNTKKVISGLKSSTASNNFSNTCVNCFEKHRHTQGSYERLPLKEQAYQPQIPPPISNPLISFQYSATITSHMPLSSTSPSTEVTNKSTSSLPATINKLQQQQHLQSYLDQQDLPSENTAQESLELHDKQDHHRRKRALAKSIDLSLISSGVLSSEEYIIDVSKTMNKLHSSSDIRKSDIRINKTKMSSSDVSSYSPSSSTSLSSSKSQSDSSLLASIPAISSSALLYSQHYLSQESSSSSFGDERTRSNSNSRISSNILPLASPLQMDVANKTQSEKRAKHKTVRALKNNEPIIIIDDAEEFDSGVGDVSSGVGVRGSDVSIIATGNDDDSEYYSNMKPMVMPLRPIINGPYDNEHDEEMSVVYAEQHTEVRLVCEVDLDIALSSWYKNGLSVHAIERSSRITDYRFIKEIDGALTITNVMLEDDGKWQCEAENSNAYIENARPVKLVVLGIPPKTEEKSHIELLSCLLREFSTQTDQFLEYDWLIRC